MEVIQTNLAHEQSERGQTFLIDTDCDMSTSIVLSGFANISGRLQCSDRRSDVLHIWTEVQWSPRTKIGCIDGDALRMVVAPPEDPSNLCNVRKEILNLIW